MVENAPTMELRSVLASRFRGVVQLLFNSIVGAKPRKDITNINISMVSLINFVVGSGVNSIKQPGKNIGYSMTKIFLNHSFISFVN